MQSVKSLKYVNKMAIKDLQLNITQNHMKPSN